MNRSVPLLVLVILAGCASPRERTDVPPRSPMQLDAETPVALEREVRYYVDEEGMLWDDRGKKHGRATAQAPR